MPPNLTGEGAADGTLPIQIAEDAKWVDVSYGPLGTFKQLKDIYQLKPPSGSYAFRRIGFRITVPR